MPLYPFDPNEVDEDDRLEAIIRRISELLGYVDQQGVTHIVTGDGNVDDECLAFVENEMNANGCSPEERQLIDLLKTLSEETRTAIWIMKG